MLVVKKNLTLSYCNLLTLLDKYIFLLKLCIDKKKLTDYVYSVDLYPTRIV